MSNYAPNTGMIRPRQNPLSQSVSTILDSPDLRMRALAIVFVYVLIMMPTIFVLLQWVYEVFNGSEPVNIVNYVFEAVVIAVVFLFGMMLLYGIVYQRPQLYFAIFFISFALVFLGAWILGEISNKCISDLNCESWKYYAGVLMVFAVTFTGYVLPRLLNRAMPLFGLAFVVIAFTQSDMWLFYAYLHEGIAPNSGSVRSLLLLFYSMFWMGLFLSGFRKKEAPERRERDPYTWREDCEV